MKVIFLHQNFPGQYKNLLAHLLRLGRHEIVFITQNAHADVSGIRKIVYKPARLPNPQVHHYIREFEAAILCGQAVARVCHGLRKSGFRPDIVIGHNGWGEPFYVKDVWPDVPLLAYFEFFYRSSGSDVGFERQGARMFDEAPKVRTRNAINLLGLDAADWGQCPTSWQRQQYPARFHDKISIVHEGIDTGRVCPDPNSAVVLPNGGGTLTRNDEVITYVARNLEPYRGFHIFMRAVPKIQKRHPNAHVIVLGEDGVSYGARPENGTHRQNALDELGSSLDLRRLHFLGRVPYATYLSVLRISSAHVYLTYPFVLSWSMLEALSAGCLVVGSSTPPVLEVLQDRENGLLVDFFSPNEIADRIDEVLSHPDRMQRCRENARQTILRKYDLTTVCLPTALTLIDDLVHGRTPRNAAT